MVDGRLSRSARVLDVGCGSGALLLPAIERAARLRREGDHDHVVGCDHSPGMVALAEAKARALETEAFRCEVQDGQALGYADGASAADGRES
jgi:ubiquinone/menaquinone biosynthesis C-methylase UbiE